MKKIGIIISSGLVLLSLPVFADQLQTIQLGNNHCAYEGSHRITPGPLRLFSSDSEAERVANRILRLQGMSLDNANFVLKAAIGNRIRNAAAVVQNQRRYLLYKQSFIQDANRRAGTDWAGISIMAHEIAHHMHGHTLLLGGSRQEDELYADRWSGFMLYKLGASRDQATAAVKTIASTQATPTHPGRAERVDAIIHGWTNARELEAGGRSTTNTVPKDFVREKPTTTVSPGNSNVTHSHNGRGHRHPLPAEGLNHQHNGVQPVVRPTPAPITPQVPEPEMVSIRGGTFIMGSPASETGQGSDEKQHSVTVRNFRIAKHEVTVGEFRRFVNSSGYKTDAEKNADGMQGCYAYNGTRWDNTAGRSWKSPGFTQTDRHPAVCISQRDALAYVAWLGKATGKRYGLPTEAQWEYAARAGTSTARYWGNDPDQACRSANVADESTKRISGYTGWTLHNCNDQTSYTAEVGRYNANSWGLKDMLGNVLEWTCSAYDRDYGGAENKCASSGRRVVRGGSWDKSPDYVSSAIRGKSTATYRSDDIGFRLSRTP